MNKKRLILYAQITLITCLPIWTILIVTHAVTDWTTHSDFVQLLMTLPGLLLCILTPWYFLSISSVPVWSAIIGSCVAYYFILLAILFVARWLTARFNGGPDSDDRTPASG